MRQLRALLKEMPICAPFCRKPSCYCAILKAGKQNLHNLTVAHSSTSQVNISQEQYITALELFIEQIKFPCNESGPLGNFERLHGQTRTQEECVEGVPVPWVPTFVQRLHHSKLQTPCLIRIWPRLAHNYRACVSFVIIVSMQLILILDSVVVVVFNINSAWQLQPQGGCEHCTYSASHFYLISTNTSQPRGGCEHCTQQLYWYWY